MSPFLLFFFAPATRAALGLARSPETHQKGGACSAAWPSSSSPFRSSSPVHQSYGAVPVWLDEGLADYLSTMTVEDRPRSSSGSGASRSRRSGRTRRAVALAAEQQEGLDATLREYHRALAEKAAR